MIILLRCYFFLPNSTSDFLPAHFLTSNFASIFTHDCKSRMDSEEDFKSNEASYKSQLYYVINHAHISIKSFPGHSLIIAAQQHNNVMITSRRTPWDGNKLKQFNNCPLSVVTEGGLPLGVLGTCRHIWRLGTQYLS